MRRTVAPKLLPACERQMVYGEFWQRTTGHDGSQFERIGEVFRAPFKYPAQ